jgi:O-antigen/teichoic acid export membrane protein
VSRFDSYLAVSADDLRVQTARAGRRAAVGQGASLLIGLGSVSVLARLLAPDDFGLVAMVAVLIGVLGFFSEGGLSTATIQRKLLTQGQVSNLFWANVVAGVLVACLAAALSPLVAWVFGRPEVGRICLALSINFAITGLGVQHGALLRRRLEMNRLNIATIASAGVGALIAAAAAYGGLGYWSLVAQAVGSNAIRVILLWALCPWRPSRPSRGTGARPMLRFGSALTGANLLGYLYRKSDDLLIGWYWGAQSLGLYSRAYSLLMQPLQQAAWPIASVLLPALSRLQDDPERFRRGYRDAILAVSSVTLPVTGCMLACSRPLVLTLLGPEWEEVIGIYRALGPAAVLSSTTSIATGLAYSALGRGMQAFRWTLLSVPITVGGFAIALPYGPTWVALTLSTCQAVLCLPQLLNAFRDTPLRLRDYASAIVRPAAAMGIAAVIATGVLHTLRDDWVPVLQLTIVVPPFALSYGLCWYLLPGGSKKWAVMKTAFHR